MNYLKKTSILLNSQAGRMLNSSKMATGIVSQQRFMFSDDKINQDINNYMNFTKHHLAEKKNPYTKDSLKEEDVYTYRRERESKEGLSMGKKYERDQESYEENKEESLDVNGLPQYHSTSKTVVNKSREDIQYNGESSGNSTDKFKMNTQEADKDVKNNDDSLRKGHPKDDPMV